MIIEITTICVILYKKEFNHSAVKFYTVTFT